VYQNFISYLYEAQHVSGDTPPIIRSLKLHWQPLVFHTWRVVGCVFAGHWQRPATTRPTTLHVCKTRGCQCSFSWWWAVCHPKTCWASYKYEIKFWYTVPSCWIFFVNYTMMHTSTNIKYVDFMFFVPCIVIQLRNLNQQNALFKSAFFCVTLHNGKNVHM
jgi:hypothetical protein